MADSAIMEDDDGIGGVDDIDVDVMEVEERSVDNEGEEQSFDLTEERIDATIQSYSNSARLKSYLLYLQGKEMILEEKDTFSRAEVSASRILAAGIKAVKIAIEKMEATNEYRIDDASSRVASITVGLKEDLKHKFDVNTFQKRVEALFDWYNEHEHEIYIGPYFPMIQSSGMGKTRLFMALREEPANNECTCCTILCQKMEDKEGKTHFDDFIDADDTYDDIQKKNLRNSIITVLNSVAKKMVDKLKENDEDTTLPLKLVLCFDEAQGLLKDDGFAFRCVRWWLRTKHTFCKRRPTQVVAVFAGTTSHLSNFFAKDPPASNVSRNPRNVYWNDQGRDLQVYPPFFCICTIGCYHDVPETNLRTDFEKGAMYGRPLFAYLQMKGKLLENEVFHGMTVNNTRLYNILKRMLLNRDVAKWQDNDQALFSLLGTRVQMGVTTSFQLASNLVSHAYANLVFFEQYKASDELGAMVQTTFMPDPVCAALAMGLMTDGWQLKAPGDTDASNTPYEGRDRTFWSRKAVDLFSKGLCIPEKGNIGEVMSALYLLFCGDILRFQKDKKLRTFSISLNEWFTMLRHPQVATEDSSSSSIVSLDKGEAIEEDDCSIGPKLEVSFIQVCRNYFQGHGWYNHKALERMYKSGIAMYVFPGCKGIDLVASIRVTNENQDVAYHPLLVSVKCSKQANGKEAFDKMREFLTTTVRKEQSGFKNNALCLLVVIGRATKGKEVIPLDCDNLGTFPAEDTFRLIEVPEEDPFGISSNVNRATESQQMSAFYSSHPYAYWYSNDVLAPGRTNVFPKYYSNEVLEFLEKLCNSIYGIE
jgi:hypothetical protein